MCSPMGEYPERRAGVPLPVVRAIQTARNRKAPILVISVAYGNDADTPVLNVNARATDTKAPSGDANTLKCLLDITAETASPRCGGGPAPPRRGRALTSQRCHPLSGRRP